MVDAEGRLLLCNQGFLDMYGFPPELARPGTPVADFVRHRLRRGGHYRSEDRSRPIEDLVEERVRRILAVGAAEVLEEVGPEGRSFQVRRRRLPDGTLVSTYHDLTAGREAGRARREQRDTLRRAEQMEATASLLAGVAHEINNPLAVVAAEALLLAEEAEGTPLAARAERVREAAQRCGRIVASLMASARRRASRREEVDVAGVVEAALDLTGYGLRAAGIDLELRVPRGMPPLRGDPDQLIHLVANLVANARQAFELDEAPADRPRRLTVAAARGAAGGVELRVADNGPGIPPELRERVFDPFFTTKPVGSGTGVGLALCRAVVAGHGGRIHAEETPGGGATLVVWLPLAAGPG
jgi:two-component system NtrC family sensor kinase